MNKVTKIILSIISLIFIASVLDTYLFGGWSLEEYIFYSSLESFLFVGGFMCGYIYKKNKEEY